ncbi:MAG: hypothetical protein ACRD0Q_08985, partial [Acidimicrobiales bacterium]
LAEVGFIAAGSVTLRYTRCASPGCRLELEGEDTPSEAALAVGWPDLRVGLANDGDDASAFHDAGWQVVRLGRGDVDAYGRVLDAVGAVSSAGLGGERRDAEPVRLLSLRLNPGVSERSRP